MSLREPITTGQAVCRGEPGTRGPRYQKGVAREAAQAPSAQHRNTP